MIIPNKNEIRKAVRLKLHSMSPEQRRIESCFLLNILENTPIFRQAHVVLMYSSLPDEVSTHEFILKWGNEKKILLPVVKGFDLELRTFVSMEKMHKTAFHITAPQGLSYEDFTHLNLIVVPGVAFTSRGERLGRGGGYYDRFLSRPEFQHIPKIGLCFPCQLVDQLPIEPHDILVDRVIGSF